MSPEQAKGHAADKRSDMWAFGCVLYEMLTGARAFQGDDVSDTLAAVLRGEPNWTALPASTPPPIRRLLRRCLEKDRKRRLADAADARLEIEEALTAPSAVDGAAAQARPASRGWMVAAVSVALLVGAAVAASGDLVATRPAPIAGAGSGALHDRRRRRDRCSASPKPDRDVAMAPDGRHLVYQDGDTARLRSWSFARSINSRPSRCAASADIGWPFISPDSHWIGFFSQAAN